jgi:hypothetical protein
MKPAAYILQMAHRVGVQILLYKNGCWHFFGGPQRINLLTRNPHDLTVEMMEAVT